MLGDWHGKYTTSVDAAPLPQVEKYKSRELVQVTLR